MSTRFIRALLRRPGRSFAAGLTTSDEGPPDFDLSLGQHAAYAEALAALGLSLTILEADEAFPDGVFVEDTAVVASGDASVVNIASMYGQVAPDAGLYDERAQQSPFHYGPAKAGLIQLSRHLAAELGPEKIRVNALVPGAFPQPGKMPAGLEGRLAGKTMLGRIGRAGEIGGPLVFLASPASRYVTGASLNVDGGWTAW